MTDSKTSHWKSLAADLSGIPPEDREPEQVSADSDESASSPATSEESSPPRGRPAPVVDRLKEDRIEVSKKESSPVSEDPPAKKKKRGSWAFWRSGNKEKKKPGKTSDPDNSASGDPLALLNQAETTDDMAVAIDQLFANTASDTRGEEVMFDADEVATSIDFDEDSRSASREPENSRNDRRGRRRDDGNSRRRRDGDDRSRPEGRDRDKSARSRNDRDDGRRRSNNRDESRTRNSDRRDRNSDSGNSERRQGRRRNQKPDRAPIDHGDVPTWDTAVSFVVDNNMVTRDGKSGGKSKSRSRSRKKSRN